MITKERDHSHIQLAHSFLAIERERKKELGNIKHGEEYKELLLVQ